MRDLTGGILEIHHSVNPDNKAKKFRLLVTTWEGALPGGHGFPLSL